MEAYNLTHSFLGSSEGYSVVSWRDLAKGGLVLGIEKKKGPQSDDDVSSVEIITIWGNTLNGPQQQPWLLY